MILFSGCWLSNEERSSSIQIQYPPWFYRSRGTHHFNWSLKMCHNNVLRQVFIVIIRSSHVQLSYLWQSKHLHLLDIRNKIPTATLLSCDVWLDPAFEVKYTCFPSIWILCIRSRFSWILSKRSRLWVTWLFGINDNVTYPLRCHLIA